MRWRRDGWCAPLLGGLALLLTGCQAHRPEVPTPTPTPAAAASCPDCPVAAEQSAAAMAADPVPPEPAVEATESEPVQPVEPDAWELLQRGLQPALCEKDRVRYWRKRYLGKPERFSARLSEFAPLLDYVSREVALRDLPMRFALVPMVESTFHGFPGQGGGPAGMWQLMPATARHLGLQVLPGQDDRLDNVRATHAALNYLQQLHEMFGRQPELTLAAYNAGDGRVRRALKGSAVQDPRKLRLPPTTLEYLDKIEAIACLFDDPEAHGWQLPPLPAGSRLEVVVLPFAADARRLAEALSLPEESFRRINGAIRGPTARSAGHAWLVPSAQTIEMARLPPAQVAPSAHELARTDRPAVHVVRSGDTLWLIARRYGLRLDDLRRWNGMQSSSLLSIGQRLKLAP